MKWIRFVKTNIFLPVWRMQDLHKINVLYQLHVFLYLFLPDDGFIIKPNLGGYGFHSTSSFSKGHMPIKLIFLPKWKIKHKKWKVWRVTKIRIIQKKNIFGNLEMVERIRVEFYCFNGYTGSPGQRVFTWLRRRSRGGKTLSLSRIGHCLGNTKVKQKLLRKR